ncbi:proton channel OtopLc-like [Euwallacea similis]|uniref:proton channel OtopLc-like n=1 Tax=Euwallacea similis TaxID=1736056 RepID=UPI0034509228
MDIVHEENSRQKDLKKVGFARRKHNENISEDDEQEFERSLANYERDMCFLHPPQLIVTDTEPNLSMNCDCSGQCNGDSSALSSRRPSAIIAALRRPSQAIALSAAQAVMNQRRYLLGLFNDNSSQNLRIEGNKTKFQKISLKFTKKLEGNGFTIILSALYAKLLVVLGIAFPITEVISDQVHPFYYQGFYLYLYLGSITFITYEYVSFVKERAVENIIKNIQEAEKGEFLNKLPQAKPAKKYGSFFLRLGAIAFGIGSMVYSGLEFGRYFELRNMPGCYSSSLQAITPATRTILTLLQVQFIFLNHKDVELNRHKIIGRFGLMHMIAMNLCEWLYVLVEETKHEITHLSVLRQGNLTNSTRMDENYCSDHQLMGSLVNNASPFLFPCTIEYSLICAVILFEMWKHIRSDEDIKIENGGKKHKAKAEDLASAHSGHHFTIDCSNSHKGLFAGIMVIVLTIISLVMFFVLTGKQGLQEGRSNYAEFEVNLVELLLYITTTLAVLTAMFRLRNLKYERKVDHHGIGLDNTLLAIAQTGMFIYCVFSIIGWYFTMKDKTPVGLIADLFSFIQTCLQTMFVLDAWWRRCRNLTQAKRKPGRELIIFLMVANMAMWSISTLEKSRAEFQPNHLKFFGDWAWTIITHISMPLAIFYRFHSTICLFEIWKTAYKIKSSFKNPLFPVM